MARIDVPTVKHIARLSALSLSDEEAQRFASELARIVAYVEELEALDTSAVEPTAHVQRVVAWAAWRPDVPVPGLTREDALAAAPRVEHDGFAGPGFVKEG